MGGVGATSTSTTPTIPSAYLTEISAVSVGSLHVCALTTLGAVLCWGSNATLELGVSTATAGSGIPVQVPDLTSNVVSISANSNCSYSNGQTCAVKTSGAVQCWGNNY
jgi:alpha-tubulin suppressor-like RCC1 family protein